MNNKNVKKEMHRVKLGIYIAALITAAGVFAIMTYLQRVSLSDFEKREIYVASTDIPEGVVIDHDNYTDYLTIKSVDAGCVPEIVFDVSILENGVTPSFDIEKGTVLTPTMFSGYDEHLAQMKEPVLAGFKADDLSKVASGVLRAGDIIDIYSGDPVTGEGKLLCGDVYIERGYDGSGNEVSAGDSAMMFNIWLESENVADFYDGLSSGSLYVVRKT